MRIEFILFGLSTLFPAGCNSVQTGACETLVTTLCDSCDVDSYTEDTLCACIEDGEVDNADRYFESEDDAELWCFRAQQGVTGQYLTTEDIAQCRQDIDYFNEFDDEVCEDFGYKSSGDDNDDWSPEDADADTDADADVDADSDSDADVNACNFSNLLCIQFTGSDWTNTGDWCSDQDGSGTAACSPDAHSACDVPAGGIYEDTAIAYYYDSMSISYAESACEDVGGTFNDL